MQSRTAPPNFAILEPQEGSAAGSPLLGEIARQLEGLQYGSIEIIVHEGNVTQIERREKVRVASSTSTLRR